MQNDQKTSGKVMKKWLISIAVFISLVVVFKIIDGTILEPRLNNIGHFMMHLVGEKLDWFTLYSSPFLKFVTVLFAFIIIVMVIKDIIALCIRRKKGLEGRESRLEKFISEDANGTLHKSEGVENEKYFRTQKRKQSISKGCF